MDPTGHPLDCLLLGLYVPKVTIGGAVGSVLPIIQVKSIGPGGISPLEGERFNSGHNSSDGLSFDGDQVWVIVYETLTAETLLTVAGGLGFALFGKEEFQAGAATTCSLTYDHIFT
jgi:hypothetical protein